MYKSFVTVTALTSAVMLWPSPFAKAGSCTTSNLSSFSRLGAVVREARERTPGKLLATWLLRSKNTDTCKYVFRIDLLLRDGRVHSLNFDAETLEPVEIEDAGGWIDASAPGAGGEVSGSFGSGSGTEEPEENEESEAESESENEDHEDNSGTGSSSSGSGSSGSGSSGSGSSGSGSSGSGSSGSGSSGSGSGGGGDDGGGGGGDDGGDD